MASRPTRRWPFTTALPGALPLWFKLCLLFVVGLITLDWLGIEVRLEIHIGAEPIVASLFRIETYFVPLGLLLAWFVFAWLRAWLSRSRHD